MLKKRRRQRAIVLSKCSGDCFQSSKPGSTTPGCVDKNKLGNHVDFCFLICKIKIVIIVPSSQDMRDIWKLTQIKRLPRDTSWLRFITKQALPSKWYKWESLRSSDQTEGREGLMYLDTCLKKETNLGAKSWAGSLEHCVCLGSGFIEQAYRNHLRQEEPSFDTFPRFLIMKW